MFRVHFVIDLRLVIAGHFISNIAVVKEMPIFESSLKVHDSNITGNWQVGYGADFW